MILHPHDREKVIRFGPSPSILLGKEYAMQDEQILPLQTKPSTSHRTGCQSLQDSSLNRTSFPMERHPGFNLMNDGQRGRQKFRLQTQFGPVIWIPSTFFTARSLVHWKVGMWPFIKYNTISNRSMPSSTGCFVCCILFSLKINSPISPLSLVSGHCSGMFRTCLRAQVGGNWPIQWTVGNERNSSWWSSPIPNPDIKLPWNVHLVFSWC